MSRALKNQAGMTELTRDRVRDGNSVVDDAAGLAAGLVAVLENDALRGRYVDAAAEAVRRYDWSVVARQIMRVYETVAGSGAKVQVAS